MDIFDRIKTLRMQNGWTQEQLAFKVGYNGRSSISYIEKKQKNLTQSKIQQFADAFGVSPAYLLTGYEGEEQKDKTPINMEKQMLIDAINSIDDIEVLKKILAIINTIIE